MSDHRHTTGGMFGGGLKLTPTQEAALIKTLTHPPGNVSGAGGKIPPATPWDVQDMPTDPRYHAIINPRIQKWGGDSDRDLGRLPDVRANKDNCNALLMNSNYQGVALWLTDFITSFSLEGTTAQSRGYRQFFPHAFTQPKITLRGQVANDYEYNRLAEFVHTTQLGYMQAKNIYSTAPLSLYVKSTSGPQSSKASGSERDANRGHIGWRLKGYVEKIEAGARKFNPAPSFEFDFVSIYNSNEPGSKAIYTDDAVTARSVEIVSWMQVINSSAFVSSKTKKNTQVNYQEVTGNTIKGIAQGIQHDIQSIFSGIF